MHTKSIIAVSGALVAMVAAIPMQQHQHHKRDYVWVTEIQEAVVTIPVTETVWVLPGQTAPVSIDSPPSAAAPMVQATQAPPSPPVVAASAPSAVESKPVVAAPAPSPSSVEQAAPASAPTTIQQAAAAAPSPPAQEAPSSTEAAVSPAAVAPSSTEAAVAPAAPTTSSTEAAVAPATPTTTEAASSPSSTWTAPANTAAAGGSVHPANVGSMTGLTSGLAAANTHYKGDVTYYDIGLGACGFTNSSSEAVVAVSHVIFDAYNTGNPNNNPVCQKTITITGRDGNSYVAEVVDRCVACDENSIDLSSSLFDSVTTLNGQVGDGRVQNIQWWWN